MTNLPCETLDYILASKRTGGRDAAKVKQWNLHSLPQISHFVLQLVELHKLKQIN